jgi:hypothetical protein
MRPGFSTSSAGATFLRQGLGSWAPGNRDRTGVRRHTVSGLYRVEWDGLASARRRTWPARKLAMNPLPILLRASDNPDLPLCAVSSTVAPSSRCRPPTALSVPRAVLTDVPLRREYLFRDRRGGKYSSLTFEHHRGSFEPKTQRLLAREHH